MFSIKFSEMKYIIKIYFIYLFIFKCGSWTFLNYIWDSHSTSVGPRCLHYGASPAGVQGEAVLIDHFWSQISLGTHL